VGNTRAGAAGLVEKRVERDRQHKIEKGRDAQGALRHERGEALERARSAVQLHVREVQEAIGLDVAALALQRKKVVVQVGVERNAARRASLRAEAKRVELGHDVGEKDDEAAPKTCGRGLHGCTNVSDDKLCREKESDFKVAALCMQVFGDL
jgi:hypothetical protein